MQEENIESLYKTIIDNSLNEDIKDYLEFISNEAGKYTKNDEELNQLFEKVIKRMLHNLKENVDIDMYDNIIVNMGLDNNQDCYDFAVGLIKSYYEHEFKINNKEYTTMEIIISIIEEYKTKDTPPIQKSIHYVLKSFFRIYYCLYIKNNK